MFNFFFFGHTSAFIMSSSRWDTSSNSKKINLQKQGFREATWLEHLGTHVDANPEQQEEDSKAHEEQDYQGDKELFVDISSALGGGNLINKEPGGEKHANGQQHQCQMEEDSQVHWAGISTCGLRFHFARHRVIHHSATRITHWQERNAI